MIKTLKNETAVRCVHITTEIFKANRNNGIKLLWCLYNTMGKKIISQMFVLIMSDSSHNSEKNKIMCSSNRKRE